MASEKQLSTFLSSGIYRFENNPNAIFIDPVRVLNRSYTRFRVSPSIYYSRFFDSQPHSLPSHSKKRKRNNFKKKHTLNQVEVAANLRHLEARPLLVKAHDSLLGTTELVSLLSKLRNETPSDESETENEHLVETGGDELDFVELAKVWQAHMYEITLNIDQDQMPTEDNRGYSPVRHREQRVSSLFNNLIVNDKLYEVEAEFLCRRYILPKESCFYMSDLTQVHKLIPANPEYGFNLIVIDPPWENGSARQKSMYPTLPNRYFLSLPIKQISHTRGALVALWVTNREKLRNFVEKELFPKWGVKHVATFYWLKIKADASLISELDLFHHRPYECLLLGYCPGEGSDSTQPMEFEHLQDNLVIISVPGDYSRKPPIGELLLEYAPVLKPARCVELFARELIAGWNCWGNEPLKFQESLHFLRPTQA